MVKNEIPLFTTNNLPDYLQVVQMFSMIQFTGQVQVSQKGILKAFMDRNRNEYQEAMANFMAIAPENANAVIGVQVQTCVGQFKNGSFMYITYSGTPAILNHLNPEPEE